MQLQYELYPRFLSEEAQLRSEQNRHLEESEIWYIVWAVAEVAGQCGKSGERLRDISLENIFMNKTGNIKILTPYSLPDSYDPYFEPNATDIYFSPEELKGRQIGQMHNESDSVKSASFAAGMLLLSLSLLKPLYHLYDYTKNTINADGLQEELHNLGQVQYLSAESNIFQFYSENYQKLLRKLLEIDADKRVTVTQAHEQLEPHLDQIANLKSFEFEVPYPQEVSPKRAIKKDPTLSLGSHKAKKKSLNQSPPQASEAKITKIQEEPPSPVPIPPLVESKYVSGSPEVKELGSGLELLRRIDERLMRSREEFPS
jgi:serine/threonine protein kinase